MWTDLFLICMLLLPISSCSLKLGVPSRRSRRLVCYFCLFPHTACSLECHPGVRGDLYVTSAYLLIQLVAGSAIQAFEEICPERIDLIHKNYRKLCNLLVDVEEWGQVVIINTLTRYARTQFLNPNANVSIMDRGGEGSGGESSLTQLQKEYHMKRVGREGGGW